jgi:acetoin utilization protein AcuB
LNENPIDRYKAEDIMTRKLAKVSPEDRLNVVIEVFSKNLFHALPVVEDGKVVGIITTHDIIKILAAQ